MTRASARQRERERLDRLAELDRAKTEFFSNVSHEFRTLTLMLGPLEEVLDDDALSPDVKEELELVRRNAAHLLRLVGTMLDFSQIEAGCRARSSSRSTSRSARERSWRYSKAPPRAPGSNFGRPSRAGRKRLGRR